MFTASIGMLASILILLWKIGLTQQQQQESEERYHILSEQVSEGFFLVDVDTRYLLDTNPTFQRLLGYAPDEISKLTLDDLVAQNSGELARISDWVPGISQPPPSGVQQYRTKAGQLLPVEVSVYDTIYDNKQAWSIVFEDATLRLESLHIQPDVDKLSKSQQQLAALINALPGIVFSRENTTGVPMQFLSNGCTDLTGFSSEELIGHASLSYNSLICQEDVSHALEIIGEATVHRHPYVVEYRIYNKAGQERWIWEKGCANPDARGQIISIDGFITDITEIRKAEEQLRLGAFYDQLTGLPNRALFMDRLDRALKRTQRHSDYIFAILFLDLDRFKVINDSLGHIAGDRLLVTVAQRIQSCLRPSDTIARFGGDEFTVLVDDIDDLTDVTVISNRILRALNQPFSLEGHEVFSTISIGIALSTTGYEHPEDLLRDADIALYRAKALGKARYEVFDTNMRIRAMELLQMETNLRHAIDRAEFLLHYQPIVFLETGNVVGFEALVRWQHPEQGIVIPDEFVALAEETGLILALDNWVLQEACRQMSVWCQRFPAYSSLSISVNLSSRQFAQTDLVEQISLILQETDVEPSRLRIEITEGVIMQNTESAAFKLNQLKEMGVQISIDDFGTGYSSLSYLHQFPVDRLKIDRTFIKGMNAQKNLAIVRTIIDLAHSLGMDVVAEGVETGAQLAQIKAFHCEYGQGHLFSKALDVVGAEALLHRGFTEQVEDPEAEAPTPQLKIRTNAGYAYVALVGKTSWKIGRSKDSSIFVSDRWASQEHAVLQIIGTDDFYLVDLGSRNGSYVNGQRIQAPVLLQHGDRVKVGHTEMEFQYISKQVPVVPPTFVTDEVSKTVLMIQTSKVQEEIWREALTSQGISVIWRAANFELPQSLDQIAIPDHIQIDLLLIDIQTPKPNPYAFSRLCRSHYPEMKVVFTSGVDAVDPLDHRWAVQQGAVALLSKFLEDRQTLSNVDQVAEKVEVILKALDWKPLDQGALASALSSLQTLVRRDTLF
jgi:diguanylate cyclase (GGDEF)-like protein/PAS domain S-box-containing protein